MAALTSSSQRFWTSASGCSSLWPRGLHPRAKHKIHTTSAHRDADSPSSGSGSSHSNNNNDDSTDSDSAMGFGGGASSRGGPSEPEPLILQERQQRPTTSNQGPSSTAATRQDPHRGSTPARQRTRQQPSITISGSAGTGAVPGYGQRKRGHDLPDQSRTSVSERDDEIAKGYEHVVSTKNICQSSSHLQLTFTISPTPVRSDHTLTQSHASPHLLFHSFHFLQLRFRRRSRRSTQAQKICTHLPRTRLSIRRNVQRHLSLLSLSQVRMAHGRGSSHVTSQPYS